MFKYSDYFSQDKTETPYTSATENLTEYFAMLEMLMEWVIAAKKERLSEGDWHSRGILPSAEEATGYFLDHPTARAYDYEESIIRKEVLKAWTYIKKREEKTGDTVPLPLLRIKETFDLSAREVFLLLLAAAPRHDLKFLTFYRVLMDDEGLTAPTMGLVDAILNFFMEYYEAQAENLLSPGGTVSTYFIKQVPEENGNPLLCRLLINDTVYGYLVTGDEKALWPPFQTDRDKEPFFADTIENLQDNVLRHADSVHISYIEASDTEDVEYVLFQAAASVKKPLYSVNSESFALWSDPVSQALLFTLRMQKGLLLLKHEKAEKSTIGGEIEDRLSRQLIRLERLFSEVGQTIFVTGADRLPQFSLPPGLSPSLLKLPLPDVGMRSKIWESVLEKEGVRLSEDLDVFDIADCHDLSYTVICRVIHQAAETMRHLGKKELDRELLQEILFKQTVSNFDYLATEVKARYTWKDIYLEDTQKKRLQAACNRFKLRNRIGEEWGINKKNAYGNAVIVLMYGPPGTGKTMAAQAIANEVMTPLYRVDVSQIFSKYIGETQKNLSRIFDEAQKRSVVLFFDEADALFTRRTEIKDSHDKYANSDTSFLLQKVEEYNGISILATNNYQSFDPAFMRRLSYVVRFERPDEETRRKMWENMLPKQVPIGADVDFAWLSSQFTDLSGSNIKSILLAATYFAAAEKRSVGMKDIILATRYEFEKLGRLIDSDDFGQFAIYMQE